MKEIKVGDKVLINKPTLREHNVIGTVNDYNSETKWFFVELERGPPWRGNYELSELELLGERSNAFASNINQDEDPMIYMRDCEDCNSPNECLGWGYCINSEMKKENKK